MVIRLNRVEGEHTLDLLATGVYRCVIPGAGGDTITRYVTLSKSGESCSVFSTYIESCTVSLKIHSFGTHNIFSIF